MMKVAYDIKLMRPGCVIVAAAMNADPRASQEFPTESWLLSPTPDMRVYETTEDQLKQLVQMTKRAMEK
jgi:hypothetical protein